MSNIYGRVAALASCLVIALAAPAAAAEKGKLKTRAVLVTTKQAASTVEDVKDHSILYLEQDGMIFNTAGAFLDKARYQLIYVSDSSGLVAGGYKTFTTTDGAKVFAKFEDTEQAHPVYKGKVEFIGGTGKYAGVKGKGVWTYTAISDTVALDEMEGEYEVP